jgi:hypothetical protein
VNAYGVIGAINLVLISMNFYISNLAESMMKIISITFFVIPLFLSINTEIGHSIPASRNLLIENRSINPTIPYLAKDDFALMSKERIGNLRIGLSEKKVKQVMNCKVIRDPDQLWGADGAYHQAWKYADYGITLDMVSEKNGAPKSIASITLTKPSRLNTTRGIGIGSTSKAVMKAYKNEWNKESSNSDTFVAGSIYGGLIFNFQNGKVNKIFLGVAAE